MVGLVVCLVVVTLTFMAAAIRRRLWMTVNVIQRLAEEHEI